MMGQLQRTEHRGLYGAIIRKQTHPLPQVVLTSSPTSFVNRSLKINEFQVFTFHCFCRQLQVLFACGRTATPRITGHISRMASSRMEHLSPESNRE
jgi:hypothetical protein